MSQRVGIINPPKDGETERKFIPISKNNCKEKGNFDMISFPEEISRCKRSPEGLELSWLHNELSLLNGQKKIDKVLEFSGGITTWVTYDSIKPSRYVCIEHKKFKRIFNPVIDIYPDIEIIHSWHDIPEDKYDLVFVDGSSCIPNDIKESSGVKGKVFRREALLYAEKYMKVGSLALFHDWGHPARGRGWRLIREYLEASENYELVRAFRMNKKGFGLFRKIK